MALIYRKSVNEQNPSANRHGKASARVARCYLINNKKIKKAKDWIKIRPKIPQHNPNPIHFVKICERNTQFAIGDLVLRFFLPGRHTGPKISIISEIMTSRNSVTL